MFCNIFANVFSVKHFTNILEVVTCKMKHWNIFTTFLQMSVLHVITVLSNHTIFGATKSSYDKVKIKSWNKGMQFLLQDERIFRNDFAAEKQVRERWSQQFPLKLTSVYKKIMTLKYTYAYLYKNYFYDSLIFQRSQKGDVSE